MKYNIPLLTLKAFAIASKFWEYAKQEYVKKGYDIGDMPAVVMNPRLTSTAGRAFNCNSKIDLSCYLFERNEKHFIIDTIPHELCHIIACRCFDSTGHDGAWYAVVNYLKVNTSRCHTMTTKYQAERAL